MSLDCHTLVRRKSALVHWFNLTSSANIYTSFLVYPEEGDISQVDFYADQDVATPRRHLDTHQGLLAQSDSLGDSGVQSSGGRAALQSS